MDSVEDSPLSHLICPALRTKYNKNLPHKRIGGHIYLVVDNSYQTLKAGNDNYSHYRHHLCPLYWCNNVKKSKDEFRCGACRCKTIGTTYYFCNECNLSYHNECVESPSLIKSFYHSKHHLQLVTLGVFHDFYLSDAERCYYCGSRCGSDWEKLFYYCFICQFSIDLVCARKPPFINYQKRHEHTLNNFPRISDLICDVCGVVDRKSLIYVCVQCDFVVHKKCIYLPFVIRISRHDHRLSFTYSLPRKLSCGVCRKLIDKDYGTYSCMKGCIYAAHSKCATRNDVWDGKELEEEPEEVYENLNSFEVIGNTIIKHFSHSHHMRFEKGTDMFLYDEKKQCQACLLPLYDGDHIYKCMDLKCGFVLHESCANLPRRRQHMAYPKPFTLQVIDTNKYFFCDLCRRYSCRFQYVCSSWGESVSVDVRCGAISEPFDHQCHPHPLFLSNELGKYTTCSMCKVNDATRTLNCSECNFFLCFRCATLPYKVRYELHEHFFTLSYEENVSLNWCEVCEEAIDSPKWLYTCNECGITLHIKCLLGRDTNYTKPAQNILIYGKRVNVIMHNRLTRPICDFCGKRCQDKTIFQSCDGRLFCQLKCWWRKDEILDA